jgi:hypothetical protein
MTSDEAAFLPGRSYRMRVRTERVGRVQRDDARGIGTSVRSLRRYRSGRSGRFRQRLQQAVDVVLSRVEMGPIRSELPRTLATTALSARR